jgi:hypothetical protein
VSYPVIRAIVPRKTALADPARIARVIENQLSMTAAGIQADFETTVDTWASKPKFVVYKGQAMRIIGTSDTIYRFLNSGTRVRRAVLSPDFRAKTSPGMIGSRRGKGGRVYVSKRISLPGIKPRAFSKTIQEKWQKQFPIQFQRALDVELNRP